MSVSSCALGPGQRCCWCCLCLDVHVWQGLWWVASVDVGGMLSCHLCLCTQVSCHSVSCHNMPASVNISQTEQLPYNSYSYTYPCYNSEINGYVVKRCYKLENFKWWKVKF